VSLVEYLYILGSIATLGAVAVGIGKFIRGRQEREPRSAIPLDITPIEKPPSWEEVYKGVQQLSERIESEYTPELIVAISSGGAVIGGMLSRLLDVPLTQITRSNPRLEETKPDGSRVMFLPDVIMKGKKILLVDDLTRSGKTLQDYYKKIERKGISPSGIRSACLVLAGERWLRKPDFCIYRAHRLDLRMPWDYHKTRR
jgi:hypothetical protein